MKRKFGESVRAKSERTMRNEVRAKVMAHNLCCVVHSMYELGINPEFVIRKPCTTNEPAAQRLY